MSLLERVYSFHQDILNNRFPNASTLMEEFEVSQATARRDIAYLRDRLLAPLEFDNRKNGFYYTDDTFSLPFGESPKITMLLGILNRFAEEAGMRNLPEVQQLEKKLSSMISEDGSRLVESLYFEWIEVESIETTIFSTVIEAVVSGRAINIRYSSATGNDSKRCVEPQRLCNYQGRWYLLAFCRLRKGLRMFHIARIESAAITDERTTMIPDLESSYLQSAFGIFKGKTTQTAEILFTGTAAELVKHQHWHSKQQLEEGQNGLLMKIPFSDEREIRMKVLQYGSQAQVLGPINLQRSIANEIAAMLQQYTN